MLKAARRPLISGAARRARTRAWSRQQLAVISTAAACRRHNASPKHDEEEGENERVSLDQFHLSSSSPAIFPSEAPLTSNETAASTVDAPTRPMTMQERFRQFPFGVASLYSDCLRYKNIRDASRTRLNAWTLDSPVPPAIPLSSSEATTTTTKTSSDQDEAVPSSVTTAPMVPRTTVDRIWRQDSSTPGRIPRRQHEQQRQLVEDLHVVLPLVVAWLPPIIGYLPMILAVLAPRQVLTRQFWNDHEIRAYSDQESVLRRHFFREVSELFWNATLTAGIEEQEFSILGLDSAGPVIDPRPLFVGLGDDGEAEANRRDNFIGVNPYATFLASVDGLPDEYLVPLALATGSFASAGKASGDSGQDYLLPRLLGGWFAPRRWLRYRVRRMARVVAEDDALLIEEGAHANHCRHLTDREVADACLLRGLPLSSTSSNDESEMRVVLSNHLATMALVHHELRRACRGSHGQQQQPPYAYTEAFGLLSLHLPILRASLCRRCARERALRPPSLPH